MAGVTEGRKVEAGPEEAVEEAPYPERIQREVRRIVIGDDADAEKISGIQ